MGAYTKGSHSAAKVEARLWGQTMDKINCVVQGGYLQYLKFLSPQAVSVNP